MAHHDKETNELIFCQVQSMQLPEQLGEIDHIFCDKTGTLTQNDLDVKALSIGGELVCRGTTREELIKDIENQQTEESKDSIKHLFECFCLCNDVRVDENPQKGG